MPAAVTTPSLIPTLNGKQGVRAGNSYFGALIELAAAQSASSSWGYGRDFMITFAPQQP